MMAAENRYKAFIAFVSAAVILLGICVNIYALLLEMHIADSSVMGNLPVAKDTASCFMLVGISLILQLYGKKKIDFYIASLFALISIVIPIMSLLQNFHNQAYQDNFSVISRNVYFGMSVQTAFCFICLGIALLFLRWYKMRYFNQLLLHMVTGVAFMVVLGHILYIPHFYLLTFFSAMAIYAAIAFFFFSIGASLINSTVGLTGMVTGDRIGNVMARRLTTRILGAMLLISSALIFFYRQQWLGLDFAIALFAVTFFTITLIFIYNTSAVLNRIERKKDMASENFRSVIESAPNALVISDMKGRISLVNKRANEIFGYVDGELIGKNLEIIVPERFRSAHHEKQPHYFKNPKPRHFGQIQDLYALRSDGTEFPVEIGLTPIITEEGTVALASIVDITELKHNEAIIRKQISEIQIRSHEMEQFIYIASHDLQEPLRTLLNYIQLLEEDYPEQLSGEIGEHLTVMKSAINRMGVLVRSLLDYGRLGQNRVLALADVGKIVKDVLVDLNTLIKTTHTAVEIVTELPELYVYETELRQLFQNLINNAIKFRKPDVAPVIKIGCTRLEEHYEFFVADNGIGIDPKYFQRIFLMFQRLHKEEEYKGYGVGLAYCNKIADIHCGRIWVESEPGEGSIFKFTILIMNDEQNS